MASYKKLYNRLSRNQTQLAELSTMEDEMMNKKIQAIAVILQSYANVCCPKVTMNKILLCLVVLIFYINKLIFSVIQFIFFILLFYNIFNVNSNMNFLIMYYFRSGIILLFFHLVNIVFTRFFWERIYRVKRELGVLDYLFPIVIVIDCKEMVKLERFLL